VVVVIGLAILLLALDVWLAAIGVHGPLEVPAALACIVGWS
jgi:predicted small lipoprotein YifL